MEIQREPEIHLEEKKNTLTLLDFAAQNQMTEEQVWELIEDGSIAARFVNDTILILRDSVTPEQKSYQLPEIDIIPNALGADEVVLPKLPETQDALPSLAPEEEGEQEATDEFLAFTSSESSDEYVLFAQDALARHAELSRQLLATKDEVISLKEEKIAWLLGQIKQKDEEIRDLKRRLENKAILEDFEKSYRP